MKRKIKYLKKKKMKSKQNPKSNNKHKLLPLRQQSNPSMKKNLKTKFKSNKMLE